MGATRFALPAALAGVAAGILGADLGTVSVVETDAEDERFFFTYASASISRAFA